MYYLVTYLDEKSEDQKVIYFGKDPDKIQASINKEDEPDVGEVKKYCLFNLYTPSRIFARYTPTPEQKAQAKLRESEESKRRSELLKKGGVETPINVQEDTSSKDPDLLE